MTDKSVRAAMALIRKLSARHSELNPHVKKVNASLEEPSETDPVKRCDQARKLQRQAAPIKAQIEDIKAFVDELEDIAIQHPEMQEVEDQLAALQRFVLDAQSVIIAVEDETKTLLAFNPQSQTVTQLVQPPPHSVVTHNVAKLPKQQLPNFDGNLMKYNQFMQQFQASVDRNPTLSNVQKFNYLLPLLKGEARKAVEGLDIEDASYSTAMKILEDRFGDSEAMKRSYYRRLYDLPKCSSSYTDLLKFLNEIEAICRSLKSLGSPPTGDQVSQIIFDMVPGEVSVALAKSKKRGEMWTTDLLLEKLKDEVHARKVAVEHSKQAADDAYDSFEMHDTGEVLVSSHRTKPVINREKRMTQNQQARQPQVFHYENNRYSYQSRAPRPQGKMCRLCNQYDNHWSSECTKFRTQDDRYQQVRNLRLCINCLSNRHMKPDCQSQKTCFTCGEPGHHSALCRKLNSSQNFQHGRSAVAGGRTFARTFVAKSTEETKSECDDETASQQFEVDNSPKAHVKLTSMTLQTSIESPSKVTLLQSAQGTVFNGYQEHDVRILLDSCSDHTFITTKLAKELRLKLSEGPKLEIHVFGQTRPTTVSTKVGNLSLRLNGGSSMELEVYVLPYITSRYRRQAIDCEALKRVADRLILADKLPFVAEDMDVDLLIGNDYYSDIVHGGRRRVDDGLNLLRSKLGWILSGRGRSSSETTNNHVMTGFTLKVAGMGATPQDNFAVNAYPYLDHPPLSDLWSLDTLGIKDEPTKKEVEDEEAIAQFKSSIRFEDGRYTVRFPWIPEKVELLPDNYHLAAKRLKVLTKRLQTRPDLLKKYDDIIQEQLKTNITEKVNLEKSADGIVNYLPHREIEKPDKETTKVRIVYDASARQSKYGTSLNDCMRRGPVFLEDLSGILLRFRLHPIALVADIEKAFHQVSLDKRDRDATRFLWLKDINAPATIDNIVVLRFQKVIFGAKSSPMLLEATVDHHLTTKASPVCEKINGNTYMDNLVTGAGSKEEAAEFYVETKSVFREIGMNMREWMSNCIEFVEQIPEQDRSKPKVAKILGIKWDTTTDEFRFDVPKKSLVDVRTKRDLVSAAAAVFDPNGLILPLTLKGKILLQKADKDARGWDKPVSEAVLAEWQDFAKQLNTLKDMAIPRYMNLACTNGAKYQLHCFTDASDKCYACAVYLRVQHSCDVAVHLVFAKGRVNPVAKLTIPRLELMGVLIGVRALAHVMKELGVKIEKRYLWTDSTCVLQWLRSVRNLGRFVSNRINEIRKATDVTFRYVPSKDNTADIPTRTMQNTAIPVEWLSGPAFLLGIKETWPNLEIGEVILEKDTVSLQVTAKIPNEQTERTPFGMHAERYSSLKRLLRVTAWCNRLITKLRNPQVKTTRWLTAEEIEKAETMWIKCEQGNYKRETGDKSIERQLRNLGIFEGSNGIIRCQGRFGCSNLPYTAKYPALLPKRNHFTKLVIQSAHEECMHGGTAQTLAKLRNKFWITGGKNMVRNVIYRCVICRRYEGPPFKMKMMPDLPKDRATPGIAFDHVGLDYFGPMFVSDASQNGKRVKKVWAALFVCLKVRAVHLEMVEDMSTASFLRALRRFIARYGKPSSIVSDHASQFELADTILQKLWSATENDPDVRNYCSMEGIHWRKITEYAPWQGGVYERLVKTVKRPLRKILQKQKLSGDQLRTLLHEVAAVVNSRPLIAVPALDDTLSPTDILTPSHFLSPHPKTGITTQEDSHLKLPQSQLQTVLVEAWKKGTRLLDAYWQSWQNLYLSGLRDQQTLHHHQPKNAMRREPAIGETVIVQEPNQKRGAWKIGKVEAIINSSDGLARSAQVLLPSKKVIQRAINHLYPLEMNYSNDPSTTHTHVSNNNTTTNSAGDQPRRKECQRQAARDAMAKITKMT